MRAIRVLMALAAVALLASGAWAGPLVGGDLLVYYGFDTIGATVADGSGHGYDGSVVRDVTSVEGVRGGAAQFGPTTTNPVPGGKPLHNFVGIPVASIPQVQIPSTNFTLAAWIKTDPTLGDQTILCPFAADNDPAHTKANSAEYVTGIPGTKGTWLMHTEVRSGRYRYVLRDYDMTSIVSFYTNDTTPPFAPTNTPFAPIANEWHHIAFTYDKSVRKAEIWINGEKKASVDTADLPMADNWDYGARLGCNLDDARQYRGAMDEVYIFSRTLSAGEIYTLANLIPEPSSIAMLVGAGLGGLVVLWRRRK